MRSDWCLYRAELYLSVSLPWAFWAGCPPPFLVTSEGGFWAGSPPRSLHPRNRPWEDPPFLETILGPILNFFLWHYTKSGNMPMCLQSWCHCLAMFLFLVTKRCALRPCCALRAIRPT